MRTLGIALLAAVTAFLAGVGFAAPGESPHCPQEDSCTVDYRDGRWYLDGRAVSR